MEIVCDWWSVAVSQLSSTYVAILELTLTILTIKGL